MGRSGSHRFFPSSECYYSPELYWVLYFQSIQDTGAMWSHPDTDQFSLSAFGLPFRLIASPYYSPEKHNRDNNTDMFQQICVYDTCVACIDVYFVHGKHPMSFCFNNVSMSFYRCWFLQNDVTLQNCLKTVLNMGCFFLVKPVFQLRINILCNKPPMATHQSLFIVCTSNSNKMPLTKKGSQKSPRFFLPGHVTCSRLPSSGMGRRDVWPINLNR